MLAHRSGWPLFRMAKEGPGNLTTNVSKYEESEKSASYSSVSHYIRSALAEYSNIGTKRQLELMNDLGLFYRKYQNELSWAGGNLNQSVKRANELAVAGLLAPSYIQEVLLPVILETQETLNRIKKDLDSLTQKAVRI